MRRDEVWSLIERFGAVRPGADRGLQSAVRTLVADGLLVRVLPGVYTCAEPSWRHRAAAAAQWAPEAVIAGSAAAALTFWPDRPVPEVDVILDRRGGHRGFVVSRRSISEEWVQSVHGLRCTSPALTAMDLAVVSDGDSIDGALRARATTLEQLRAALAATSFRTGNRQRHRLLLDSRAEPWSALERMLHRTLRAAGITGWRANRRVVVEDQHFFPDLTFRRERVVVEADGDLHRTDRETFIQDRRRQNLLQLDGWFVLRYTYPDVLDQPEVVVTQIRRALKARSARQLT